MMNGSGKYWPLAVLIIIPGLAGGAAVGDSLAKVKSDLGDPRGSIVTSRGRQVVYYNRGHVTFVGGQVKEVSLQSDEDIALAQERLRQAREASIKSAAQRKEIRIVRGMALRKGKLADPVFLSSTPELRLRFWQDFMRVYPEVDVYQELQKAHLAYQVSENLKEQEERMVELEERTRRAEKRTIRTEHRSRRGFYTFGYQSLFNNSRYFRTNAYRGKALRRSFSGNRKQHFRATSSRGKGMRKSFSRGRLRHRNITAQPRATAPVRIPTFFSASITSLSGGRITIPGID